MNGKEEKRLLEKCKALLEKNLSLKEIERALGVPVLEEKPEEIMKLAYQLLQDEEYVKLHHYIFVSNIEDYATKYYIENLYNQMRR